MIAQAAKYSVVSIISADRYMDQNLFAGRHMVASLKALSSSGQSPVFLPFQGPPSSSILKIIIIMEHPASSENNIQSYQPQYV